MALTDISVRDIIIAGSVCGAIIFILLIILAYFCCRRQRPYKDYEANPAHRRLQPVNAPSGHDADADPGVPGPDHRSAAGPSPHMGYSSYQPVGNVSSAASTDSQFGAGASAASTAATNTFAHQQHLLRPASVGAKPYALVTPHHSQQQPQEQRPQDLHFDNMALSPSDPQGKLFATAQSARYPLDSNEMYRLDLTDYSSEQYGTHASATLGHKQKKVVYEVVV